MLPDPIGDCDQGLAQRATELRKLILDARWDGGVDSACDQAVSLKLAQGERQHALRDIANGAANLVEAHGATGEQFDDQYRPLVADAREGLTDSPAFLLGLLFVTGCQKSAFLRAV